MCRVPFVCCHSEYWPNREMWKIQVSFVLPGTWQGKCLGTECVRTLRRGFGASIEHDWCEISGANSKGLWLSDSC